MKANRLDAYERAKAADYSFRAENHYRPADRRCGNCRHHACENGHQYLCRNPRAYEGVPKPLQMMFVDPDFVCDQWAS